MAEKTESWDKLTIAELRQHLRDTLVEIEVLHQNSDRDQDEIARQRYRALSAETRYATAEKEIEALRKKVRALEAREDNPVKMTDIDNTGGDPAFQRVHESCVASTYSSRVCEYGTKSCIIRHNAQTEGVILYDGKPNTISPVVIAVFENKDSSLSCFFCHDSKYGPRPFSVTLYTLYGRAGWGAHKNCYERAVTPVVWRSHE